MKFKAAAVQFSPIIGEVEHNNARATAFIQQAVETGAKLVCLPEMFNTGYFCHTSHCDSSYFELAESVDGNTMRTFRRIAAENHIYLTVPMFEIDRPGVYYNSCYLLDDHGEVVGRYRKTHIPWSQTGWEKYYVRPGYEYPVFKTPYGNIGILICYDRDFPEAARTLGLKGTDLLLIPNGAPERITETWKSIVKVRAYENQYYVLGASLTGRVDDEHYSTCGHSLLANPRGEIVDILGSEEAVLTVEVDYQLLHTARTERFLYRDRRPEIYNDIPNQS